jgi:hypothetical protein
MPLIPDTMNPTTSGGTTQEWMQKLMGKKLGDSHSETSFAKKDLPSGHRVIEEGGFGTMDHRPERLVLTSETFERLY